jgi:spore germination protein GerM
MSERRERTPALPDRPTPGRARWVVAVLLAGLALLTAACGIPTDDDPRVIADETITTPPPATDSGLGPNFAILYLSDNSEDPGEAGALVTVRRNLESGATPTTVLEALFAGPLEEDIENGFVSLIPTGTTLDGTDLSGSTLTVELSDEWSTLRGPEQTRAYAQVVLTVTELDAVQSVRFRVMGDAVDAPTPTASKDEVRRSDYAALEPPDA